MKNKAKIFIRKNGLKNGISYKIFCPAYKRCILVIPQNRTVKRSEEQVSVNLVSP